MRSVVVMRARRSNPLDNLVASAYATIAMIVSGNETYAEHMKAKPLTAAQEEVVRLYTRGLSARQAGAGIGLSTDQVYRILRKAGVKRRRRGSRPPSVGVKQRNREVVRLYDQEGLTLREVGARVGLSHERVRKILEAADVSRRGGPARFPPREQIAITQQALHLYVEDCMTLQQVGARLGLSARTVERMLETAGVHRRRGSCRLSQEEETQRNQEIARLYVQGRLSCKELGVRFGLTEFGVRHVLEAAGIGLRPGGLPRLTREERAQRKHEIVRLYFEEGLARREIAARLSVSNTLVNQTIQKCGTHPRLLPP
jgi:DNA-binding CsgD family transcriptional regulator/predicted DNA-binding protein (UPF0251 family)